MIKDIIAYEQPFTTTEDRMPRNYYNPNIVMAEREFCLKSDDEILIVINGNGYRYSDDTIYTLKVPKDSSSDSSSSSSSIQILEFDPSSFESMQLCLFIKNTSNQYSIHVGYKSPLSWLLDMPLVYSKLCYCSVTDLTHLKLVYNQNRDIEPKSDNCRADKNTIYLHE
jgi:predicted YcjX-like family ATPase